MVVALDNCGFRLIVSVYYVVPGVTDLRQAKKKIQVEEAVLHEYYDSDTYDYDIAILKVFSIR